MNQKIRRAIAVLLTLLAMAAAVPAGAVTDQIMLVAVNDSLPYDLTDATMPFYSGGSYYVPYTVFENSELGIYSSYNSTDKILTLYNRTNSISFYMNILKTYDSAGTKYNVTALSKNGVVFVPVSFLCEKFLLGCTITAGTRYTIIRITSGTQRYSSDEFNSAARSLIDSKIEKYLEAAQNSGGSGGTGGNPQTPPQTPPGYGTASAVLWVDVGSGSEENMEPLLQLLEGRETPAIFFLDAAVTYSGDFLRCLYASGHRIGFRAQSVQALEGANEKLFQAARFTTRYAHYTGSEDIEAYGYIPCGWDISYYEYAKPSGLARALPENRTTIIRFDLSKESVEMLGSLIELETAGEGVKLSFVGLRETMLDS